MIVLEKLLYKHFLAFRYGRNSCGKMHFVFVFWLTIVALKLNLAAATVLDPHVVLEGIPHELDCTEYWDCESPGFILDTVVDEKLMTMDTYGLLKEHEFSTPINHTVSSGGYNLTLIEIPGGPDCTVVLHHGYFSSGRDFVLLLKRLSIVAKLVDSGCQVFLAFGRGTIYSSKHDKFTTADAHYWNFSVDNLMAQDYAAIVLYIRAIVVNKDCNHIIWIGHSLGTAMAIGGSSLLPFEIQNKIFHIMCAPVMYLPSMTSPIHTLELIKPPLLEALIQLNNGMVIPPNFLPYLYKYIPEFCSAGNILTNIVCLIAVNLMAGNSYCQTDLGCLSMLVSGDPQNASAIVAGHLLQWTNPALKFHMYDYGFWENFYQYGSFIPPSYATENISSPMVFIYGKQDGLCDWRDVLAASSNLKNPPPYLIEVDGFNHLDFLCGKCAPKLYDLIVAIVNKYRQACIKDNE